MKGWSGAVYESLVWCFVYEGLVWCCVYEGVGLLIQCTLDGLGRFLGSCSTNSITYTSATAFADLYFRLLI